MVAKWLYARHPKHYFHEPHRTNSVFSGEVLEWLMNDYTWHLRKNLLNRANRCLQTPVETGDFQVIESFYSKLPNVSGEWAIGVAATKSDLPMIKRHCELGAIPTAVPMDAAAKGGHLEMAQWLHGHHPNVSCTTRAMDSAAAFGHLEMVQWLHANRSEGVMLWMQPLDLVI